MTESVQALAGIVAEAERAAAYGAPVLKMPSQGGDVFVMSDLHLSEGRRPDGTFSGLEKFYADESFRDLLEQLHAALDGCSGLLVLNGDIVDFLRVTRLPRTSHDFEEWWRWLHEIGIEMPPSALRAITAKERTYSFKTHEHKSVWRLSIVAAGHRVFFAALARWLSRGHRVAVVKGNHDLEWYWPGVRNRARVVLAELVAADSGGRLDREAALDEVVLPRLAFADRTVLVDGVFYIEHGHPYDKYSHVEGPPILPNRGELNLPFGSFFNRYLLNRIELAYPFIDNVRPRENLLPLIVRERFPLALKLLFQHIPFLLRIIPKGYYAYMFRTVFVLLLAILLPVALLVWAEWPLFAELVAGLQEIGAGGGGKLGSLQGFALRSAEQLGVLLLSYLLARIVAALQLVEPDSLSDVGTRILAENPGYRFVAFGHTHNPDQVENEERWFYNTGTWVVVLETSSAEIRRDKTYTYLHMPCGSRGLQAGRLLRWNDDAHRMENALLVRRVEE